MSSLTSLQPTPAVAATVRRDVVASEPVTLIRVIRSEWIKFRSLRSTVAVLAAAMLGMIAIALIVAYNTRHLTTGIQADDAVPSATMQGYYLGQLLIGALGVLFVTGEYSTGMIRSSLAAVPKRRPVLLAKLVVFTTITALSMVSVSVIAFVSAQALLSQSRVGYSLTDPGVLRPVIGTGIYLTLIGILAGGLGWIVRSTPGALTSYFAVVLVLPVIFGNVLGSWGKDIAEYLPSSAGASFVGSIREPQTLSPWVGLGVLTLWVVAAVAVAAVVLQRRDA